MASIPGAFLFIRHREETNPMLKESSHWLTLGIRDILHSEDLGSLSPFRGSSVLTSDMCLACFGHGHGHGHGQHWYIHRVISRCGSSKQRLTLVLFVMDSGFESSAIMAPCKLMSHLSYRRIWNIHHCNCALCGCPRRRTSTSRLRPWNRCGSDRRPPVVILT